MAKKPSGWDGILSNKLLNVVNKMGHSCEGICENAWIGDQTGKKFACSKGFDNMGKAKLKVGGVMKQVDQAKELLDCYKKGFPDPNTGLFLNGEKYQFVNVDKEGRYLVLKRSEGGAVVGFTNKLMVIGTFNVNKMYKRDSKDKPQNLGDTTQTVQEVIQMLVDKKQ